MKLMKVFKMLDKKETGCKWEISSKIDFFSHRFEQFPSANGGFYGPWGL